MLYRITYTNILTGEREAYMNIGFETKKSVEAELGRLLVAKEKYASTYTEDVIRNCISMNIHIPSCVLMDDWKIEPIKLRLKK